MPDSKKARYFLHFESGEHHFEGDFFYWLTFKKQICRRDFDKIMEEAEKPNDRFASLSNKEFQERHGILSFKEFRADYQGYLEPLWLEFDKDGKVKLVSEWESGEDFSFEQEVLDQDSSSEDNRSVTNDFESKVKKWWKGGE